MCEKIKAFGEKIGRLRDVGRITILVEPWNATGDVLFSRPVPLIQNLVKGIGYCDALKDSEFKEIDAEEGRRTLSLLFGQDIAYRNIIMTEGEASSLADEFYALFISPFFIFKVDCDLTRATFQDGMVILDPEKKCLVWIEDED